MTVTHVVRYDAGLYWGGGEIQAERTGQALEEIGVEVVPYAPTQREFGDLVHFFGNFDYFDEIASHLRDRGIPYVVSPIFVSPRTAGRLRWRRMRQRTLGHYPKGSAALLAGAKALLTLTIHEETSIRAFFGDDLPRFVRIPNGVEPRFADGDAEAFRQRFGIDGLFAIQVATIDRSKNQLATIEACKPTVPLVIIGRESDPDYAAACRSVGGDNVRFLGTFPHDDPTLADALAAAHVFILPSYRELFPLSAMEATVAGCHLLLSNRWGGEAIWGTDATFFDPDEPASMRRELERLMAAPRPARTRSDAFLAKYSWTAVAVQIRDAYASALA